MKTLKLNIGTGPDKCEGILIMRRERAFPQNLVIFFFLIGDATVVQKAPGCSENRQKSIAHLLKVSELVCVECNRVPEHLSEQGLLGRTDNRKDCLCMSAAAHITD